MSRKPHQPTPKTREKVAICKLGGMSDESIALALGISRPTLLKAYKAELTTVAAEKRAEVLAAMFKAAKKGNVAAQRAILARTEGGGGQGVEKLGKKEQAQAEAGKAQQGTEWADLLPDQAGKVVPIRGKG